MSETNKHIDLFSSSGCLTPGALKRYSSGQLTSFQKEEVDSHLESCELCSDALEGIQLLSDPQKLDEIVIEIKNNLKSNLTHSQAKKKTAQNRLFYIAAAASVIILVGIFSYFKFYTQKPRSGIATLDETTLYEQTEPIHKSEEHSKAKVIVKDDIKESKPAGSNKSDKIENQDKGSDNLPVEVMESELEFVMDEANPVDNKKGIIEERIEEVVMAEPALISEEEDLNEFIVSEYVVSSKGMATDQMSISYDQATSEIQTDSISPSIAKKGRQKSSEEKNSMIKPDSLSESTTTIFSVVEEPPEFPGGEEARYKYFQENLVYPDSARILEVQGRVFVSFVVMKSGKIKNVEIRRGIEGGCNEAAIQLIKSMPNWIPGKQKGKPVNVQMMLPILFKLDH